MDCDLPPVRFTAKLPDATCVWYDGSGSTRGGCLYRYRPEPVERAMTSDLLAFLMFLTAITTSGLLVRSLFVRRRLERKLWTVVAQYGIPVTAVRSDLGPGAQDEVAAPALPRIEQVEGRLDQLADQLERLAESQDFISRILADRLDGSSDSSMRTPH